jgi:nitroimidazol reductase NimA-like FMN-containing flavoprotein (pyridoxamine 5'-phosphate oxidase superfamily)
VPIDDGLEVLSEEECRALLEQETVGRVGLSVDALPAILPVNYAMVEGGIVFRTGEGGKLRAALCRTIVAFEVDHIDPIRADGWSVLVVGMAEPVGAPTEPPATAGPTPWAGGSRPHLVRISPEVISGRRIVHPVDSPDGARPDRLRGPPE